MFTDRNFNGKRSHNDHSHGHNPRKKRCFCCGKEGCWSNRHTQEERDKAYQLRKAKFKTFVQFADQFILECKGIDPGPEDSDDAYLSQFLTTLLQESSS